jgi:hypothetical protein
MLYARKYKIDEIEKYIYLLSTHTASASPEHSRALLTNPQRRDIIYAGGEFNEPIQM